MSRSMVILYTTDPESAKRFWREFTRTEPTLDAPGMTEFEAPGGLLLGLMPEAGIRRLLPALAEQAPQAAGPGRAELYLTVDDPGAWLARALQAGAVLLDEVRPRDWGDEAGYVLDPWGHVLAFSRGMPSSQL